MKIIDKVNIDTAKQENEIILFLEGTFWKAYEKSAWLFCHAVKPYAVKKKFVKAAGMDIVSIGFPQTVDLPLCQYHDMPDVKVLRVDNADVEKPDFDKWKEELPYTDKKDVQPLPEAAQDTENLPERDKDYVLRKISTFPVESMTPFDCMLFIMEMKDFINGAVH